MENKPKSMWARLMDSLDLYGAALAYDREEELCRRVSRLEKQVQALWRGAEVSVGEASPKQSRRDRASLEDK